MSLVAFFHAKTFGIQVSKTQLSICYVEKSLFYLMKENNRLHEDDDIAEHMILTIFIEETEYLSDSKLNCVKRHYTTYHWKVRKLFRYS
jgi:hypothetical protein